MESPKSRSADQPECGIAGRLDRMSPQPLTEAFLHRGVVEAWMAATDILAHEADADLDQVEGGAKCLNRGRGRRRALHARNCK